MSDPSRLESHEMPEPDNDQPLAPNLRVFLTMMIVFVLVVVGGGTTWWLYSQDPAEKVVHSAAGPCTETLLHVVAAPEIAPVVSDAARIVNGGSDCGAIGVTAQEPAATSTTSEQPDVWIPSSSAWLRISLIGGASAYNVDPEPLARSPIVLAAPAALTPKFADGDKTSWLRIMNGVADHRIPAFTVPDPLHSSVGMLAVYAIQAAMDESTPDAGIAQLRSLTLRSRLKDASADPATLLRRMAGQSDPVKAANDIGVFPITEQQLTAYQHAGNMVALAGSYPSDGLIQADYPYAVSTATEHADLAAQLRAQITAPALTDAGFRTYEMPHAIDVPERSDKLLAPALLWGQYRTLAFQVLLLIDASGSMNKPATDKAGHATTKAGLLKQSGLAASQLFGDETSMGMWFFGTATPASPAHAEAVSFGPITGKLGSKTRRDVMARAIRQYNAPGQAGTPLYRTLLDAQAAMRPRVRPGAVTLVIVLSDGTDGESKYAMPKKTFLQALAKQQDPKRPVPVIGVGFGPDADLTTLTDIATVTGGKAIAAKNPADLASAMAQAFLAAHAPS